ITIFYHLQLVSTSHKSQLYLDLVVVELHPSLFVLLMLYTLLLTILVQLHLMFSFFLLIYILPMPSSSPNLFLFLFIFYSIPRSSLCFSSISLPPFSFLSIIYLSLLTNISPLLSMLDLLHDPPCNNHTFLVSLFH